MRFGLDNECDRLYEYRRQKEHELLGTLIENRSCYSTER
jgi:hypothetical protein